MSREWKSSQTTLIYASYIGRLADQKKDKHFSIRSNLWFFSFLCPKGHVEEFQCSGVLADSREWTICKWWQQLPWKKWSLGCPVSSLVLCSFSKLILSLFFSFFFIISALLDVIRPFKVIFQQIYADTLLKINISSDAKVPQLLLNYIFNI